MTCVFYLETYFLFLILCVGLNFVNQEVFRTKLLLKDFYDDFKNSADRQIRMSVKKKCLLFGSIQPISLGTIYLFDIARLFQLLLP